VANNTIEDDFIKTRNQSKYVHQICRPNMFMKTSEELSCDTTRVQTIKFHFDRMDIKLSSQKIWKYLQYLYVELLHLYTLKFISCTYISRGGT